MIPHSERDLLRLARQLYVAGPYVFRQRMHHRIRICPFDRLIAHVQPGASVLDAGCGAGLFLALLAGTVPHISGTGFDPSQPAIESARAMAEQVKRQGLRADLHFLRLDAGAAWPAGAFDVVSLVDVVHHVAPELQIQVLERAAARVKPGGILLYKDMAARPLFHAWMNRLHDLFVAHQWIHYLPVGRVDAWAASAGLTPIHGEEIARLWYRHELRIYRKPIA